MKKAVRLVSLILLLGGTPALAAGPSPQALAKVRKLASSPGFAKAVAALEAGHQRWIDETIALTEIPAPPFKEAARAEAYKAMFEQRGLSDVEIDEEGNVLGLRKGSGKGGLVIVSAHLDTVFPESTKVV